DRWYLEVVIRRRDMQSFSNRIDIVLTPDPTVPGRKVEPLILVGDYNDTQKLAEQFASRDADREVLTRRLESIARQLRELYPTLDAGERQTLRTALGGTPALARDLQSLETFEQLHR
ncbi:MAG TPA: hypothetical protein PKO06_16600, partial [Candidatus Ozemobacteraceae bacterium]|nr:hypothetical protein [Candidatus Ozemobacteraceae bacterium]